MLTISPVCLIRYPESLFERCLRAARNGHLNSSTRDEDTPANPSLRWTRLFHDWYMLQGKCSLVTDADELTNEEHALQDFCEIFGLGLGDIQI